MRAAMPKLSKSDAKSDGRALEPIPGPRAVPLLGNVFDLDTTDTLKSMIRLGEIWGPIYQITVAGQTEILVTSQEMVEELSDESRFVKSIPTALEALRPGIHDGLFTAYPHEENWAIAHRICMPVFGPIKIGDMLPEMSDIGQQLCLKWARMGPDHEIDVTSDFTRLTLDTIGLCAMDFRFNSFYTAATSIHPFIDAMNTFLEEAGIRSVLPGFVNTVRLSAASKFDSDIATMRDTVQEILDIRRQQPTETEDLLNCMLHGRDSVTGKGMSDGLIISNMITFLIAGHETTSGMLSFTTYYMLRHPESYARARKEIDDVVGSGPVTIDHLHRLKFVEAMLKESLRLMPTAPGYAVQARKPEVIGGKYHVDQGQAINVLLHLSQTDKKVFGPDAGQWRPERMLDEEFQKLPPGSWKPFGNGSRACIGRAFAMQEALLVLAMTIQTFDLSLADPMYQLRYKETLTIKPEGLRIRARLRHGNRPVDLVSWTAGSSQSVTVQNTQENARSDVSGDPVSILYGSNAGTCKALAYRLAAEAERRGLIPQVGQLNTAVGCLPEDRPIVMLTTSYEGEPTDDAKQFVQWLQQGPGLDRMRYAVFGCGHRDWAKTLHKIPTYIDARLQELGAHRLSPLGTVDVSDGDVLSTCDNWQTQQLWPALGQSIDAPTETNSTSLSLSLPLRATSLENAVTAIVMTNRLLTSSNEPEKRHIEFKLQGDCQYQAGDHFYILVHNPPALVQRALAYFHLAPDALITVKSYNAIGLPANTSLTAYDLFASHLEIAQPATTHNISQIASLCKEANMTPTTSSPSITSHTSVLSLLEQSLPFELPLETYISLLPSLRNRIYSASSSPNWNPPHASLTYSIPSHGHSIGPSFLASLNPGNVFHLFPRPAKPSFHLPSIDMATTTTTKTTSKPRPIIMIAAGTGIAPFRAFIQDRILDFREEGKELAPAMLFFGCRRRGGDELFREEMEEEEWERDGGVRVVRAFSKGDDYDDHDHDDHNSSKNGGKRRRGKYVQDIIREEEGEVRRLWRMGAKVYICGSGAMADGVMGVLRDVLGVVDEVVGLDGEERIVVEKFD